MAHLLGRWRFTGFPAWLLWLGVHLLRLIGFRNRLVVLINWAWDYLFYERVIRLILPRKTMTVSKGFCNSVKNTILSLKQEVKQ